MRRIVMGEYRKAWAASSMLNNSIKCSFAGFLCRARALLPGKYQVKNSSKKVRKS
jgi:hypothetical protein